MINRIIVFFIACTFSISAQDAFHGELISALEADFGVTDPSFTLFDSEAAIIDGMFYYGNGSRRIVDTPDAGWTKQANFVTPSLGDNQWDAGTGIANQEAVSKDDIILVSFWAREVSEKSLIYIFAEHVTTFDKQIYFDIELTSDWTQYFIPYKSTAGFMPGEINFGFHLAGEIQEVEIAGFTVLNYKKNHGLNDFPSTFSAAKYGGFESDAAWRSLAAERIETLRKSDLEVTVVDTEGNPVADVEVTIEMLDHEFGFGSAYVTCRFPSNDCTNATYTNKIKDLDGKGHGFNVGVMENAMKWDGWEEEWIGSPEETVSAIQWLADEGVEMRGHTMFWPGYEMMPDDIQQNEGNLSYVRNRIDERIRTMVQHPVLSQLIGEWDVLNEVTLNRDLELMFQADPQFTTGREIYQEIFARIKAMKPDQKNYMNDYVTLSGGGSSQAVVSRYKQYLDEIYNSESSFDGIGFQCHIGTVPTSILKVESTLNEFYERYPVPFKITEYDIEASVSDDVQAQYMADFLTMIFSHPAVEAFIMWGFWDGNHWKNNAPMFNMDWSLKPSGQAFIDKVFDEWWSSEQTVSDASGQVSSRVFKGTYEITVRSGDQIMTQVTDISEDTTIQMVIDATTSTEEIYASSFQVMPNPVSNRTLSIEYPQGIAQSDLKLFSIAGILVYESDDHESGQKILLDQSLSGLYYLQIDTEEGLAIKKIIVE